MTKNFDQYLNRTTSIFALCDALYSSIAAPATLTNASMLGISSYLLFPSAAPTSMKFPNIRNLKDSSVTCSSNTANLKATSVQHYGLFYILLTVRLLMFLGKWPTWRTILFYIFISILYMFRATPCSSSGVSIVPIQPLVYVTLCWWPFRVQVGKELPFRPAHETVTDTEWHIPEVVLVQLILLMMSTGSLETCRELK